MQEKVAHERGIPYDSDEFAMRESDMPIVVKTPEKVKAGRAKGHYCNRVSMNRDRLIEEIK